MFGFKKSHRPAGLPEEGRREKVDPTPVARPIGWQKPPSLQETIQRAMRAHFEAIARENEVESFEDADDFDVDDDPELKSPYEIDDDLPKWKEKDQKQSALNKAEEQLLKTLPQEHSAPGARGAPAAPKAGAKGSAPPEEP